MALRGRVFALIILCFVSVRAADASLLSWQYTASWASSGFFPLDGARVQVRGVADETGHPASFDIKAYLADGIRQRLSAAGAGLARSDGADAVEIELSIHLYQEGSAFARWMGGGIGAAYVVVQAHFRKGAGPESADLMTVSVIGSGGLYSAGGEKTVLDDAADVVAAYLKPKAAR